MRSNVVKRDAICRVNEPWQWGLRRGRSGTADFTETESGSPSTPLEEEQRVPRDSAEDSTRRNYLSLPCHLRHPTRACLVDLALRDSEASFFRLMATPIDETARFSSQDSLSRCFSVQTNNGPQDRSIRLRSRYILERHRESRSWGSRAVAKVIARGPLEGERWQ
jgi:hypothetical protein